jgi:hypothetical protein
MKKRTRIFIVSSIVFATFIAIFVWRLHFATASFRDEGKCRFAVRGPIGQAKLSYASWKRLPKGTSITEHDIATYFEEDRPPSCPSGGKINIGTIGEPVRCSLAAHARLACNDRHDLDPYMRDLWFMDLTGTPKGVMMNLSGVRLLFADLQWPRGGSSGCNITIGGTSTGHGSRQFTRNGQSYSLSESYSNGVTTVNFSGNTFQLIDNGTVVVFDKTEFKIGTNRSTILVSKENGIRLLPTWEHLNN